MARPAGYQNVMQGLRGIIAGLLIAVSAAVPAWAIDGRPSIMIDAATGRVLHSEAVSQSWYPASLTKLITAYVVFDAIRNGEVTLDTPLTYSALAAAEPPAKMGFKPGTIITVDNALKMLIVRSANDIAVMIAENLGGSSGVAGFVDRMNNMAVRLGMTGSRFVNPNGLPGEGQVTTARDMGLLAQAIYRDFPQHTGYFKIGAIKFGKRTLRAYNLLLARYDGADGMKTGFICSSGFNLVASASRGGRRLIVVVLGSTSGRARAETAARLLEDGFTHGTDASSDGFIGQLESRLGLPADIREEICLKRPVTAKAAGESDGLDSGDGQKTEPRAVLAAVDAPIVAVPVFIGSKPDGPETAPAGEGVMALTSPVPSPRPITDSRSGTLDPAEIVREVRRAVAGGSIARRMPGEPRQNLSAGAAATTPIMPAQHPTPSVPMPHARPKS